jgi:hypothetical protein
MSAFDLGFLNHPGLLWWLALLLGLLAGIWSYYRLLAPLGRATRLSLRVLRLSAFGLLLFLILGPLLTTRGRNAGTPRLAVLIDRSSSMSLPGANGGTRASESEAVWTRLRDELDGRFDLVPFAFAGSLESGLAGDRDRLFTQLPALAGTTALGDALEGVLVQQGDSPLGGILLITDGVTTTGKDAARVARNLPVPVFSVVVGDTVAPPDLLVREVRAHPLAYVGEPMALQVVLQSRDLAGYEATVTVRELDADAATESGGRELVRQSVRLGRDANAETEVHLEITPARAGLALYEVTAAVPDSEAVRVNNSRRIAVDVRDKKTQVLFVEGEPDWDFAFLKRAFDADTTLAYVYWVRQADGAFRAYGRAGADRGAHPDALPRGAAELSAYAAVIVGHLDPAALPADFSGALHAYASDGGGVLFMPGGRGEGLERWRDAGWGDLLPLRLVPQPSRGFGLSGARVAMAGLTHEITALDENPAETERLWKSLPPIWLPEGDYAAAETATTLLTAQVGEPQHEVPLLAIAPAGAGRVAVLTGRGLWRWDFVMRSSDSDTWVARDFWKRMCRWLSQPTERERFAARPVRNVFQDGEPIDFAARLLDDAFRPLAGARVELEVEPLVSREPAAPAGDDGAAAAGDASKAALSLYPEGTAGRYAGSLASLPPGAYRYSAQASIGRDRERRNWRSDGRFWVEPMGPEFLSLPASPALPQQLARVSGGSSVTSGQVDELIRAIPKGYRPTRVVKQAELWNHWPVFALVTILLAAEWVVRRRQGLA